MAYWHHPWLLAVFLILSAKFLEFFIDGNDIILSSISSHLVPIRDFFDELLTLNECIV